MAKVSFLLQSKSSSAEIYLRLTIDRTTQYKRKTGIFINPKDWSNTTALPKQNNSKNKNLSAKLKKLSIAIIDFLNTDSSQGVNINGQWLSRKIDIHFERISDNKHSDLITDTIDLKVKYAATTKNGKGGIGLSVSRINAFKAFKKIIEDYQKYKRTIFRVSDVDIDFGNDFSNYLLNNRKYSKAYALKKVSDLKVICSLAESLEIKTNPLFKKISSPKPRNNNIIFLSLKEIEKIEQAQLSKPYLINARKWLLLGCSIGQRGGDLLNITQKNFTTRKGTELIELTQQKTQVQIAIPVTANIKRIIKNGLPHPISLVKFNLYLKEICQISKIDSPIDSKNTPKWQKITSHCCRRTFATLEDNDDRLTRKLIMHYTGHSTETALLNYIGKRDLDIVEQILAAHKRANFKKENEKLKAKIKALKKEIKQLKNKNNNKLSIVKKLAN